MAHQTLVTAEERTYSQFVIFNLTAGADLETLRVAASGFKSLRDKVAAQFPSSDLDAVLAFGNQCWSRLSVDRPAQLRGFQPHGSGDSSAPATGGDVLLHVASETRDACYEVVAAFMRACGNIFETSLDVSGFRYRDSRDLTGFIDGTENPEGDERAEVALIGDEDPAFRDGSYVLVQRFVHDLGTWETMDTASQENIIGRTKADSVELDEAHKPDTAHISRVVIEEDGDELEIVRHSAPYGSPASESGLLFIAYSRELEIFEKMLSRMYGETGDGLEDALMGFTTAVSGAYFFAPSGELLEQLAH